MAGRRPIVGMDSDNNKQKIKITCLFTGRVASDDSAAQFDLNHNTMVLATMSTVASYEGAAFI